MKSLKLATKAAITGKTRPHTHVLYFNEDSKQGACSTNDGHTHPVTWQPANPGQPAQTDPMGNVISPEVPPQPEQWIIGPAADGHMHGYEEVTLKPVKQKKEDDEEVVARVIDLFKEATTLEDDSIKEGKKAEDFYLGKQWPEDVKAELKATDRASLTINYTQKMIDELCGYQRQNRQDIKFTPVEGGDQKVADMATVVAKVLLERSQFRYEESDAFEDAATAGRGWLNIYTSSDRDLRGEVRVERFPWSQVVCGPHEKKSLEDCEYIIKHRMYSLTKLRQLFKDKADKIKESFTDGLNAEVPSDHIQYQTDQYSHGTGQAAPMIGNYSMYDVARKQYRLMECYERVYVPKKIASYEMDDFAVDLEGWDEKLIPMIETMPGFQVLDVLSRKIRLSQVCGNVLLSDVNPAPIPGDDFPLVPIYAARKKGRFFGKVAIAFDPQMELNKRRSQAIDIGNKLAAYGWFYDDETFGGDKQLESSFKANSTKPGFMQKVANQDRPPTKVEGVKFPTEIAELANISQEDLTRLINITVVPEGANDSALKLAEMKKERLVGNERLWDNLSLAKQRLGRLLLSYIREFYPPERILQIVKGEAERMNDLMVGGKPWNEQDEAALEALLRDDDMSSYDIEVTESAYSPTVRLQTLMVTTELARHGVQFPPESYIELADIPQELKDKMLSFMQQQASSAQQADMAKSETELEKTLIAQGFVTPKAGEMLGFTQPEQQPQDTGQPPAEGM